jgi:hypothetical protein
MARFYARFDHGYLTASGQLGETSSGNYFERRVIGSATSSNALLKSRRESLSDAMYAQMDGVNKDPTQGPIIPQRNLAGTVNNIVRSGGNLSWTNIYKTTTIPGVAYPVDFRTRPTGSVFTDDGNLTAASPADGGSISDTLYTDAGDALTNVLASIKKTKSGLTPVAPPYTEDGSPYVRLGTTPSRTLHSLWHDVNMDYFAWDDFTPGQPQTFTYTFPTANNDSPPKIFLEGSDQLNVVLQWTPEFLSDRAGDALLYFKTIRSDNLVTIDTINVTISEPPISPTNGLPYYSASLTANSYNLSWPGAQYNIESSVQFRDATIPAHTSTVVDNNVNNAVQIIRVYAITGIGPYATTTEVCAATTTTVFYNDGAGTIAGTLQLFSNKTGTYASAGYYRDTGGPSGVGYIDWDGGSVVSTGTCP